MKHDPEFTDTARHEADETRRRTLAHSTANAYARLFVSEDGKAVLEDLLAHDTLFHSDAARERWEAKARANVTAEVAALS
jgi:predicted metal-dependent HD superfamily phosphohydrolase